METALMSLPSSQRSIVRKLSLAIDDKTGMGYYAAMDFVANLGLFFARFDESSAKGPRSS